MLWYGSNYKKYPPSSSLFNKNKYLMQLKFFIPANWNFSLLSSIGNFFFRFLIFLTYDIYFFQLPLPYLIKNIFFCVQTKALILFCNFSYTGTRTFFFNLNNFFFLVSRPFFFKIKFKGKGYYVFKSWRQVITPQFGFSHRRYFYNFFTKVKFLSKTIIFFFGLTKKDLLLVTNSFFFFKPINIFTGRGVRFSKQIIYKKVGKVSAYR